MFGRSKKAILTVEHRDTAGVLRNKVSSEFLDSLIEGGRVDKVNHKHLGPRFVLNTCCSMISHSSGIKVMFWEDEYFQYSG